MMEEGKPGFVDIDPLSYRQMPGNCSGMFGKYAEDGFLVTERI